MSLRALLGFTGALGLTLTSSIVQAQVTADSTANSTVVQTGQDFSITQGTAAGSNLFHSFQRFSVPTGGSATFNLVNTPSITTIFSRVTGGSISNIDGLIQTRNNTNPVSLFLINPAGVLFGPNARLNIGGSFFASTASSFKFADGSEFSATNPQAPPVLTINLPLGLQTGAIPTGSTITHRGSLAAGQDLILEASYLDLQGQLVAGRDLTLRAEHTVQIRDTVTDPFVGRAGGSLTVQGVQGIDLLALNHPNAALQSGGNLSLISNGTISGDAHFISGGSLSLRTLTGRPGRFISLFDPIIYANGDVIFGDYTGVALKVEATGSIEAGNIRITGPDAAIPASDPDFVTLTTQPAVILRAGVASVPTPNLPQLGLGGTDFTTGTAAVGYLPGSIVVSTIDTSDSNGGNGGSITLTARGDIATTGSFTTPTGASTSLGAYAYSDFGDSGNGGAIAIASTNGNISVNGLDAGSVSFVGNTGNGGAIAIASTNGNISLGKLFTASESYASNSGNGGTIRVVASNGSISLSDSLNSSSSSYEGTSGNGGAIVISAVNGNLTTSDLNSSTFAVNGSSGNGGAISLTTQNGNLLSNSTLLAYSISIFGATGTGGAISLSTTNGNLTSTSDVRSSTYSFDSSSGNGGAISLSAINGNLTTSSLYSTSEAEMGDSGNGGAITVVVTNGNLTTSDMASYTYSVFGTSGNGGAIDLSTTNGNLTATSDLFSVSFSYFGNSGNGGAIGLSATNGNLTTYDLQSFSYSAQGNSGDGGAITAVVPNGTLTGTRSKLNSFSVAPRGQAGQGGTATLSANDRISGLEILTASSSTTSGAVSILGQADLAISDTVILTSKQIALNTPFTGPIIIPVTGTGRSGDVTVSSAGDLSLTNSRIESDTKGTDAAGNVSLTSPGLIRFDNSQIASSTTNSGQAGNITLTAGQGIDLANRSTLSALTTNAGQAGDITLNAPTVTVSGNAEISAATQGSGGGGTLTVNAPTAVNLLRQQGTSPVLSVEASGAGQAGDIVINTANLTLADQARITATATATATTTEGGGSITLNASQMNLAGIVGVFAETQGQAPAGTLRLNPYATDTTLAVNLASQSQISAATSGSGRGGDLILTAPEAITLSGAGKLAVETSSSGNAGNISITTGQLTLQDRVQLSASSSGSGKAGNLSIAANTISLSQEAQVTSNTTGSGAGGNITLTSGQTLSLTSGSSLSALTTGAGKAGDIRLTSPTITLAGNAQVSAATSGSGAGGTIAINATTAIDLAPVHNESPVLSVETNGAGKAGDIVISTPRLTVGNNARITATATATATSLEGGGSITLNASQLNVGGTVGVAAETQGQAPAGTLRLNPYANDPGLTLTLSTQSKILASTSGSGNGGDLILAAPAAITLSGPSKLAVETSNSGNAGNILVSTRQLTLTNGVELSASSSGSGRAGNLTIAANTVALSQGARVSSNASGAGAAGDIVFRVTDQLTLKNTATGLFATTAPDSTGNGGSISVAAKTVLLQEGGTIAVGSLGQGAGGNIAVQSDRLTLDTGSALTAEAASTQGGNITLDVSGLLLLRRNSLISTTAGTAQAGGNGGSITIQNTNGFILGVPQENSDIRANAFTGNGGKVNITTQGIFGLQFRLQNTSSSDITASSQFGVNGSVQIQVLSIDPSNGLTELPTDLADPSRQIAAGCIRADDSSFIITGRGGIPDSPTREVRSDRTWADTRDLSQFLTSPSAAQPAKAPIALTPAPIVEASTLKQTNGQLELVAVNSPVPLPHTATCTRAIDPTP
jgi:filamentous hemagglutinin family protein